MPASLGISRPSISSLIFRSCSITSASRRTSWTRGGPELTDPHGVQFSSAWRMRYTLDSSSLYVFLTQHHQRCRGALIISFALCAHGESRNPRSALFLPLNPRSSDIDLSLDDLPGGSPDGVPLLYTVLKVEDILDVFCEMLRQVFPLFQSQI